MVEGFAGFGFPKAHSAAFGLLAYQSTWLRVHYGAEFLCALLNEQPMGFYAPDSLVHEAENRGIAIRGLDVNASQAQCTVERGGVRLGLGYIKGVASAEVQALVAERERGGPFASLGELAGRVECRRGSLEQLAWSGACDRLIAAPAAGALTGGDRRVALWQLGMASPATTVGHAGARSGAGRAGADRAEAARGRADTRAAQSAQLALPLALPAPPRLRPLGRWQRLIADYSTSGVTVGDHVLAVLRERLTAPMLATSAQLPRLPSGCQVAVAGLVIARQRPGTAKGTMFLLFEDEFGTVNLIVPKAVYERHRQLARAEPLLLARGKLERAQDVVNVIVRELAALERFLDGDVEADEVGAAPARVHRMLGPERPADRADDARAGAGDQDVAGGEVGASMRAAAPPVQSFARGRRR
jgi:error-prone DNA polymerase